MTYLGTLREGRKEVILVSEGFSNLLPPGLRMPNASAPGVNRGTNPMAGEEGQSEQEQAAGFFTRMDMEEELRSVYEAADRNNTSIYTLDPRGLAVNEFDISQNVGIREDSSILSQTQDTLRTLADETDGRAIVNQNNMERGLRQLVKDASDYYLLGYTSTATPTDGKFHRIDVSVDRPGVTLRARKGYWALSTEETTQMREAKEIAARPGPGPAVEHALSSIAATDHSQVVQTWIGTSRGTDGKTAVTFVWQPVDGRFGQPARVGAQPARVMLTAAADTGAPYFRGAVPQMALASAAPPPPSGGLVVSDASDGAGSDPGTAPSGPSRVTFQAAPGPLDLRLTVQGSGGQVLDFNDLTVQVPDFTKPQVALSTPAVYWARTAYEFNQLTRDPHAVPTASRTFSRGDQLLIRFEAYGPGGGAPSVTAELLNRAGASMTTLPVTAEQGAGRVSVPLTSLPAGDYLVQIKATSGDANARQLVAFRVVS